MADLSTLHALMAVAVDERPDRVRHSDRLSLTALMVSSGVLVVDQDGRRWCMLGRHGFTMSNGVWWWGSPAGLLCEVTTASTVAALEAWCAARPGWFTHEGTTASTAVGRPW